LYDEAFSQLGERYYPGTVPQFENTPYVLLVTHTATTEERLTDMVRIFIRSLPHEDNDVFSLPHPETLERITETTFLYSLFDAYTNKTQIPVSIADGIIVPHSEYVEILTLLETYLYSLGKLYTITGNAGSGHISIVTLFDQKSTTYEKDLDAYTKKIFSYVQKYKGGISASGGEGLMRTPLLPYVYNEMTLSIFKDIKHAWDPLLILNGGKKISTTSNYLREHLSRTYKEN
jgi:FAD/FMN-containing dehydrogenase